MVKWILRPSWWQQLWKLVSEWLSMHHYQRHWTAQDIVIVLPSFSWLLIAWQLPSCSFFNLSRASNELLNTMNWPLQCSSALLFSPYPNTMHTPPSFPSNKKQTLCTSIALTILLRTSSSKNACCQCDHPLFQLQAQSWAFTTKATQQQQSCQLPSCALQQLHPDTNSIQSNKPKKLLQRLGSCSFQLVHIICVVDAKGITVAILGFGNMTAFIQIQ